MLLQVAVAALASYSFARLRFPGRDGIFIVLQRMFICGMVEGLKL